MLPDYRVETKAADINCLDIRINNQQGSTSIRYTFKFLLLMFKITFVSDDISEFNVFLNEKNEEMKEGRKREDEMKRMKQVL